MPYDQATLDAAFAAHDQLLEPRGPRSDTRVCICCGSTRLQRTSNPGQVVDYCTLCEDCGTIQPHAFGATDQTFLLPSKNSSNYKRIHHWHERISQLMLCESQIPDEQFLLIAERLCDGSYTVLNKDVIRSVLRSLKMQMWIEKWLQIIQRITLIEPPKAGGVLLMQLDSMFQELQAPFERFAPPNRKNFLNYNYVFCRMFQQLGCPQFSMFFPLIKSRAKLKALDETWQQMVATLNWPVTPLQIVQPFAVKLEQPDYQLQRIRQRVASAAQVETRTMPARMEFRKSDQRLLRELDRQKERARRRSAPPVQEPQTPGWSARHLPRASAAAPRPLRRLQLLRRPV